MAERILRSPGITTRELDLSAPGRVRPQGIPAGIIGTSQKGPAFVPVTFATANDFANIFGTTEGKHYGAMAVNEWMRNARSGLYLRVLGVGNGQKATSLGYTTNAGFVLNEDRRDNTDTTLPTDMVPGVPGVNPYAGSQVDNALGNVATDASNVVAVPTEDGQQEIFTLTIEDQVNGYDGTYIVYEDIHDAGTQYIWWVDAQSDAVDGNNAPIRRQTDGTSVTDGGFEIFNAVTAGYAAATVQLLDGAGVVTGADLMALIEAKLAALYPSTPGAAWDTANNGFLPYVVAANAVTFDWSLATTDLANDPGAAYLNGAGTLNTSDSAASSHLIVKNSADAISGDIQFSAVTFPVAYALNTPDGTGLQLSFTVDANISVPDGSSLTLVGADGTTELVVEFNTTGTPTADTASSFYQAVNLTGLAAGELTADAIITALTDAYAALVAVDTSNGNDVLKHAFLPQDGIEADLTFTDNTTSIGIAFAKGTSSVETVPALTISENSPNAPAGSTWFLGQEMKTADNDVDYLDDTADHSILRGVVMFASGVVPGILDIDAQIDPDLVDDGGDMPNAAWGEYAVGKNQGNSDYLGKVDSDQNFIIALNGFTNNSSYDNVLTGSFDPLSPIYFPKVLNTDPTKLQEKGHYLYASYDVPEGLAIPSATLDNQAILKNGAWAPTDVSTDGSQFALSNDGNTDYQPTYEDFRSKFSHAFTPWIMSQKLGNATKKLFRFHMLDAGVGGHNNVKISIVNISRSTDTRSDYGTFDVVVRSATDTDLAPEILQTFSRCSLNPASDRYIARIIGDQNTFFEFEKDLGKQKLVTEGLYPNRSQFVRVEVVDQIESGMMEATALPCGFAGKHHLVLDGKSLTSDKAIELKEAPLPLRQNVSVGSGTTKVVDSRFYWGVQYQDIRTVTQRNKETGLISLVSNLTKWFPSHGEYAAWVGDNKGVTDDDASLDADDYNYNAFSLENIWVKCLAGDTNLAVDPTMWQEAIYIRNKNATGVNANGAAYTEANETTKTSANGYRYLDVAKDFGSSASKKYYKFTVPFQGGFDGFDIFDQDKAEMNNISAFREMSSGGISAYGGPQGPTTAAFRKGLDILAEKSDVDVQILATPGMRSAGITDYAIDKTEDRFDALFILDVDAYDHDQKLVVSSSQETSVSYTAQALADRNLDTSFAAAYFPDVVIRDGANNVVVPPSVAVLGALSLNDKVAHPWFAPAGFARGALASTIETQVKLNRANMDVLYDSDINPITAFPHSAESVVVFGQKTMLQAQSALDRVNVRRLLIDVRRKVRKVANQILFEPNRETTLARFSALVNPILGRIQQQQGLDRYKVIIDTTTTTQQDVENNTIRGKIFLQPTRSIEFISLDFVVTNQGAEI